MSVYRPVEALQLTATFESIARTIGNLVLRSRDDLREKIGSAVTLISMYETKGQVALGGVALPEALDAVYEGVKTLRRPLTVTPDSLIFLGRSSNPARSLAITFDENSQHRIMQERTAIIDEIEDLATESESFIWPKRFTPHVSLAIISGRRMGDIPSNAMDQIFNSLPEELHVQRAVLYNPHKK